MRLSVCLPSEWLYGAQGSLGAAGSPHPPSRLLLFPLPTSSHLAK